MNRYAVMFTKKGYIKYISHLDLLRLFQRVIKRSDIPLSYSQGFNPHPKMGFAQPLSLGYESFGEILEMEIKEEYTEEQIAERLSERMPEGIEITGCVKLPDEGKSLAALVYEAEYLIAVPLAKKEENLQQLAESYLEQKKIIAWKKQKKTKQLKEINIRPMIRKLQLIALDEGFAIDLCCDCGSDSNLSPELVISTFLEYSGIQTPRSEIEVMRKSLKMKGYEF